MPTFPLTLRAKSTILCLTTCYSPAIGTRPVGSFLSGGIGQVAAEGVHGRMNRRWVLACSGLVVLLLGGCSAWTSLTTNPDSPEEKAKETQKKRDTHDRLVGDVCVPYGMFPVRIEAVGWVTGLHGTGSDPEPSPQRAVLVEEMQRRGVDSPNTLLASRNASMVLLRAVLRPGIQKGDHFDVEVRTPGRSETTSLRGGYLLETRLRELAVLGDGMIHNGRDAASPRARSSSIRPGIPGASRTAPRCVAAAFWAAASPS